MCRLCLTLCGWRVALLVMLPVEMLLEAGWQQQEGKVGWVWQMGWRQWASLVSLWRTLRVDECLCCSHYQFPIHMVKVFIITYHTTYTMEFYEVMIITNLWGCHGVIQHLNRNSLLRQGGRNCGCGYDGMFLLWSCLRSWWLLCGHNGSVRGVVRGGDRGGEEWGRTRDISKRVVVVANTTKVVSSILLGLIINVNPL